MSDFRNKDKILQAIDELRRRKARPDIDRICNLVFRRFGIPPENTKIELQQMVDAEIVIKVDYKGNTSYRNAAKWSKYAMYKDRAERTSSGSTAIHTILSRAFGSLLVEDPDYLDIGVPRMELERIMIQDDPLTDLTEIELILTKAMNSRFLIELSNGNYSLTDHAVPSITSPKSTSTEDSNDISVQPSTSQKNYNVSSSQKTVKFKKLVKEKMPKVVPLASTLLTATEGSLPATTSPMIKSTNAVGPSTSTAGPTTSTAGPSASTAGPGTSIAGLKTSDARPRPSSTKAAIKSPIKAISVASISTELGAIHVDGQRVGVRRKTAKKVFDPSDNYTPTRKRGRPPGSGSNSKKDLKQSGGKCCLCHNVGSNTYKTSMEKLIQCRDCSNRAHLSCILRKSFDKKKPQLNNWVCYGCKLCAVCSEPRENEEMVMCVHCGEPYHIRCHKPPVTEEQRNSKWACASCNTQRRTTVNQSQPVKPKLIDKNFLRFIPKEETPDPTNWTIDQVCKYLEDHGCAAQAAAFRNHEIDGRSLLMLKRHDVLYEMGLKAGPALKVYHFVQLLQVKDIKKVFPFNEMLR